MSGRETPPVDLPMFELYSTLVREHNTVVDRMDELLSRNMRGSRCICAGTRGDDAMHADIAQEKERSQTRK